MTSSVSLLSFFLCAMSLHLVRGQNTNATCVSSYGWANNNLGQSPCLVASYLETACLNTSFLVPALPNGSHYTGPNTAQANLCNCNTVTYSLISACADCQNRQYLNWGNWTADCAVVAVGLFPEPVPAGTAIPQWAYININSSTALYNPTEAEKLAEESGAPAASSTTSSSTASTPASSTSSSNAATASTSTSVSPTATSSSGSNAGAIAGGVVGGIVFLMGTALVLFWFFLQRRRNARAAAGPADMVNYVNTSHVAPPPKQETLADRRGQSPMSSVVSPYTYEPSRSPSPPSPSVHATSAVHTTFGSIVSHGYTGAPEI
ncbi:hypothetical protein ARMSODRAFT_968422 [Armillaria solidipes]|uniref:Uncharacterized protein n=1 Tax=Armillaria solidipes TaxID=1076256 RepID=A0A2H3CAB1_9AGAR|nr:hypothetical protein ARMSODRAFT_968422 [Armillaria solidipes]